MMTNLTVEEISENIQQLWAEREVLLGQIHAWMVERHFAEADSAGVVGWQDKPNPRYAFGPTKRAIADAMYETLMEERPLHRKVLLQRVMAKGIEIRASSPMKHMAQLLTLDARFKKEPGQYGCWTLSEKHPKLAERL